MSKSKSASAGWVLKLTCIVLSVLVIAAIFGLSFSATGREFSSMVKAALPSIGGLVLAAGLGSLSKFSHKRWHIYLAAMFLIAAYLTVTTLGWI